MNYELFNGIHEGTIYKYDGESDQEYWERILKGVLNEKNPKYNNMFNEQLDPSYVSCNAEERSLTIRVIPQQWHANPNGLVHGGITSAILDIVMGLTARFISGSNNTVTISINVDYLLGIPLDHPVEATAYVTKSGKRMQFMRGEIRDSVTGKTVVAGTGVYM